MHAIEISSPGKPKQADGEDDGANDAGDEAILWTRSVRAPSLHASVGPWLEGEYKAGTQNHTKNHADVGKIGDAGLPATFLREYHGVGGKEEVEDAVDKGGVEGCEVC